MPMKMKTVRMHAGWDDGEYSHFYASRRLVEFCGYAPEDVHEVELREAADDEETPYWGWEDADDGSWGMIWPSKVQLQMCFTYGMEAAITAGKGRPVRLIVTRRDVPCPDPA